MFVFQYFVKLLEMLALYFFFINQTQCFRNNFSSQLTSYTFGYALNFLLLLFVILLLSLSKNINNYFAGYIICSISCRCVFFAQIGIDLLCFNVITSPLSQTFDWQRVSCCFVTDIIYALFDQFCILFLLSLLSACALLPYFYKVFFIHI